MNILAVFSDGSAAVSQWLDEVFPRIADVADAALWSLQPSKAYAPAMFPQQWSDLNDRPLNVVLLTGTLPHDWASWCVLQWIPAVWVLLPPQQAAGRRLLFPRLSAGIVPGIAISKGWGRPPVALRCPVLEDASAAGGREWLDFFDAALRFHPRAAALHVLRRAARAIDAIALPGAAKPLAAARLAAAAGILAVGYLQDSRHDAPFSHSDPEGPAPSVS